MSKGWKKLYVDILDSPIFANPEVLKVYIYCLANAGHKTKYLPVTTGKGRSTVTLHEGQLLWGRMKVSERLQMSPSKCERHLKFLHKLGYLVREPYKHYSKITVLEFESQSIETKEVVENVEQPMNKQRTTNEQPMNTTVDSIDNIDSIEEESIENSPPKIEEVKEEVKYEGGGKIALPFRVKSLFIQQGLVVLEDDMKHCGDIAYKMRDAIKQHQGTGSRPSDDKIFEGCQRLIDKMPAWIKEKGYFSPSFISRKFSDIFNEIMRETTAESGATTKSPKVEYGGGYA